MGLLGGHCFVFLLGLWVYAIKQQQSARRDREREREKRGSGICEFQLLLSLLLLYKLYRCLLIKPTIK